MVKRRKSRKRSLRSYPSRRYRSFRKGKAPLPLLPILGGIVAPMTQSFQTVGGLNQLQADPMVFATNMADQLMQRYTGFALNPNNPDYKGWNFAYLMNTYGGLIAGIAGHKLATKFGINAQIRKVPVIGKWVQL